MDISLIKGIVMGAVIATAGGAVAGYQALNKPPEFAEVVEVLPATEQIATPREVCKDVEVTHQKQPRDKHRVAGTATGAVIGGVLGNQIGSGSGKTIATVAGAAAGAFAGNKLQKRAQANDTYTTLERQCSTVTEYVEKVVGYDVTYRIGDEQGEIRMDHDPGERIALTNGELVVN